MGDPKPAYRQRSQVLIRHRGVPRDSTKRLSDPNSERHCKAAAAAIGKSTLQSKPTTQGHLGRLSVAYISAKQSSHISIKLAYQGDAGTSRLTSMANY